MLKVVVYTPKLGRVLQRMANTPERIDLTNPENDTFQPQTLDSEYQEPQSVQAVSGEYNSYFKIIDSSETSADGTVTHKISIVDGYDRGYCRSKVNNKVYDLKYHTKTITKTSLIALRFNASEKKVEYYFAEDTKIPDDSSEYSYCQLGTVSVIDSSMTIQQDHLCGIAQMFWYDVCGD
jgi:hypothetical protein